MILDEQISEKEFNLLYEPWILVKMKNSEIKEYSILEVFRHAHEAEGLAGELPTQDIAIMRLLLAIMHATFVNDNVENADDAKQLWSELWELKQFPYNIIETYLKQYEERFWLFHPEYPFYQVADLANVMNEYKLAKGKKIKNEEKLKTVARLVGDLFQSDNAPRLFSGRNGNQQKKIPYDEAARWLLHLNGFDDDSAKNPTPKGVGYLGQLGLLYAKGSNLFETLMLNFILVDDRNEVFEDSREEAKAYWEKPVCKVIENQIAQPNIQKDLLTFQSRRILLKKQDKQVIGYLLTMGDFFNKEGPLLNEQMTVWKKDEKVGFIPKRHMPERQMWRDLSSIISVNEGNGNTRESGIIHWLRFLKQEKLLFDKIIKIYTVGGYYRRKGAGWQIIDYVYDSLQINSSILENIGKQWLNMIDDGIASTDKAILCLGWLASDIATVEGNSREDKKDVRRIAREKGYGRLDGAFRQWLMSIDPNQDSKENKMSEWMRIAKNIILTEGKMILNRCSDKALVGFIKQEKNKRGEVQNINAFNAFRKFQIGIKKELG